MKKLIPVIIIFFALNTLNAQKKLKSTPTYDLNFGFEKTKKQYKANFDITKELILVDGSILTIGQEVKLGPSSSKVSNQYETIIMGKYNLAKAMLLGPPTLASTGFERNKYIIEEMRVARSMGKVAVAIFLKDIDATGLNLKYLTASDYSITRGELINPNRPMTRAEAIAKLKESKDLLELDMMSKEEFDALKAKLSPIIRGN